MCPFCGKTYKRLKSHLPHCKAAPGSNAPPVSPGAAQTRAGPSTGPLGPDGDGPPLKPTVAAGPQAKKSKKGAAVAAQTRSSSSPSERSSSPPPSAKKKKHKLSGGVTVPPPAALSPPSQQPPRPSDARRKTSGAGGPQKVTKGDGTIPGKPPPAQEEAKVGSEQDPSRPASQPVGNDPPSDISASDKKAARALSVTHERSAGPRLRHPGRELGDSGPVVSGDGPQPRITLQDAKALLGRDGRRLGSSAAPPPARLPSLVTGPPPVSPLLTQFNRKPPPSGSSAAGGRGEEVCGGGGGVSDPRTFDLDCLCAAGVPAQQHLAQVRLKDVPEWLVANGPSSPRDLVELVQKGELPQLGSVCVCVWGGQQYQ